MQDQGLQNLFPQNAKLNTEAYKTLENELADWIEAGGEVKLNVKLYAHRVKATLTQMSHPPR